MLPDPALLLIARNYWITEKTMKNIFYRCLTDEHWGFLRFLADGFIGLLFIPSRFLVLFGWFAAGSIMAKTLNRFAGISMLIGTTLSVLFILLLLWAISVGRLLIFFPFPPCRQKKCNSISDYTWIMGRIYGREKWGVYRYWCMCDDEYIRQGKRFMQVSDDTEQSYMILDSFRNWQIDKRGYEREK